MKTKIKLYVDWSRYLDYLLLAITIVALFMYGHIWIGVLGLLVSVIKDRLFRMKLKKLILIDFRNMLEEQIKSSDWTFVLPSPSIISSWIGNYEYTVGKWTTSRKAWESLKEAKDDILKTVYVPCLDYSQKGLSLYNLYYCDSIDPAEANPNESSTLEESLRTSALLKLLPLDSLLEKLDDESMINTKSLYCLFQRQEIAGDFSSFCCGVMDANISLFFTPESIDLLIKEFSQEVPINFPKKFLAYVIAKDPDVEKRKRVFDWYVSQKKCDIDKKFFLLWPQLTQEEIPVMFKIFDEKDVLDQIFIHHQLWEHVSTEYLKSECFRLLAKWRYYLNEEMFHEVLKRMK